MKHWPLILGGTIMFLVFLYGSLSALVNQGLSLLGAAVMLVTIVAAAAALLYAVKE